MIIMRLLCISFLISTYLNGMQQLPQQKQVSLDSLPPDLRMYLIPHLGQSLQEIGTSMRRLQQINRRFYHSLNNEKNTEVLIKGLAQKFNTKPLDVALDLRTDGIRKWLLQQWVDDESGTFKEALLRSFNFAIKEGAYSESSFGKQYTHYIHAIHANEHWKLSIQSGNQVIIKNYSQYYFSKMKYEQYQIFDFILTAIPSLKNELLKGTSPLLSAIASYNPETVARLLQAGADVHKHSKGSVGGETPVALARTLYHINQSELKTLRSTHTENNREVITTNLRAYRSKVILDMIEEAARKQQPQESAASSGCTVQ